MNTEGLWEKFLASLEEKVNPMTYNTWFKPLELLKIDNDKNMIIVKVPMAVHISILANKWYSLICDTIMELTHKEYDFSFVLDDLEDEDIKEKEEVVKKKEEDTYFESNLIPRLNFDNYIIGDTNKFAKTVAFAVAEAPGSVYNPLFIYGKSGLGKTHLMHAIGNYIVQNSDLKVLYVTSEQFMKDYTGIVSDINQVEYANNFKNKYRNIDVLIIDDIQYLVGAPKTQEEFFHTFNELHQHNKQIIISSDRSPDDLKLLEERLRSRFTWGLPVDIYPPDFDLRCRIIKDKIKYTSIANLMSEEAIEFVANNYDSDVRRIEGAINRLVAYTAMSGPTKITLDFAAEALKDDVSQNIYNTSSIAMIQKATADYYGITVETLKSKKRSSNIAYPRQIAMYLSRMLTEESLPRIGLEFGGRDHATVIHAISKIEEDLKQNGQLKEIINEIKAKM